MHRRIRALAVTLFIAGIALSTANPAPAPGVAPADSWHFFRGSPQQCGVSASKLPDKLDTLWTFQAGEAFEGAVAVADGMVYAGSLDENLYALDLKTGKKQWSYKAGPIKAAPVVHGDELLVGDIDGTLHCIGRTGKQQGKKQWEFSTGGEIGGANYTDKVILVSSHDENLYCLSKGGKQRWKFNTQGPVYGAPTVAQGKTFLVGCDSTMHVIELDKGKEIRSVDLGGQTGATAAVIGDDLYVGTMRNDVQAIDWQKGSVTWTYRAKKRQMAFFSSPAVTDKIVVIGGRDNLVHAIERKTGNDLWTFPTRNKVDSSPVIAGDRVVVGSLDSHVYVLELNTGKELQRIELDSPIAASPVVVDGKVLIGTQKGTLYCLGARK
jgi:outer membrane protein assembly factor BamB